MVTTIQTEVDDATRLEIETVLQTLGVTLPDAIAMLMRHIATEKSLPFPMESDCPYCPITPSPETLAAIAEAEQGNLRSFESVAEFLDWLDEDD